MSQVYKIAIVGSGTAGLAAAIPAVIAYNHFHSKLKKLTTDIDNFSADYLNIIKRHFFH